MQGFIYQFNKTLLEVLKAPDGATIQVEGIVEDIEVHTATQITATQCKYHESKKEFVLSDIYKPVIQMMSHYHKNSKMGICYVLYAHFPSLVGNGIKLTEQDLATMLASQNAKLKPYIKEIQGKVNTKGFLHQFRVEVGASFDALVQQVCAELKANGIPEGDVEILAYPNAIHMIASLSIKHDETQRKLTKKELLDTLHQVKKTAISRWTLALATRKKLLHARRRQLKANLDKNSRLRYFVISQNGLHDFEDQIVIFISEYLEKFHSKAAHVSTPVFCLDTSEDDFKAIQIRLHQKGVISNDGFVASTFDEVRFFREPMVQKLKGGQVQREFSIRFLRWAGHGPVLNSRKGDDLFFLGGDASDQLQTQDVNIEVLASSSFQELKFMLGMSDSYE